MAEEGWLSPHGPWPRTIVFALQLRDPLPIAHGTVFTRVLGDEAVPELADIRAQSDKNHEPLPPEFQGQRLASLKIWQLRTPPVDTSQQLQGAISVLNEIGGLDSQGRTDLPPLDSTPYFTVVEAVTIVTSPEDAKAGPDHPDPLTRCITALVDLVRAYRLSENVQIPEVTYETLHPLVPFLWRDLSASNLIGGLRLMMLSHLNIEVPSPQMLDDEAHGRYMQVLSRLVGGDPFTAYMERRLEAQIALHRNGQYAESAIQSGIAAEVLLANIVGLLLWEESRQELSLAVNVFADALGRRVKKQLPPRLKGNWSYHGDGAIAMWRAGVANLRNRVVHAAYRPNSAEAKSAFDALLTLEKFVGDRLAANSHTYPRAALIFLGRLGLEKRGLWSDTRFDAETIGEIGDLVREYVRWRDDVIRRLE